MKTCDPDKHVWEHSSGPHECIGTDDKVGIKRCKVKTCRISKLYNMDEEKYD